MDDKDIRKAEILAFITVTVINYFIFGWYITIVAAVSMLIMDRVVNYINKTK